MATDYEDHIYTPAPKPAPKPATEQPTTPPNTPPPPSSPAPDDQPTKAQISSVIPAQYTASSYAELIPQLEKQMQQYKPPTEEELQKMRRKQRAEGIIAGISDAVQSVANLWFTNNYAPNMYDANSGMSARTKARFEKEKAEREADTDRYFNYALKIGKMKDEDREAGLKAWAMKQNLARQDRAYETDVEFRNKEYNERVRQWQANFDRAGEWHNDELKQWERQFEEGIRQFNVHNEIERKRLSIESSRLSQSIKQGQMTFNLGEGQGNVTLSLDKLNAQTVSRIFSTLPQEERDKVKGEPIVKNGFVVGNNPPTIEAMLIAIGANVGSSPATQDAIREVAGLKKPKPTEQPKEKPRAY